jgi:FkbM family methyltransferase
MKATSIIYQLILKLYSILPAKRHLCLLLRKTGIPHQKFYRDLKFRGVFSFQALDHRISVFHHGGTIENELFWNGLENWERDTVWLWCELVKNAHVVYDIGANTGVYSLIASSLNTNLKVHAFEPSVNIYGKLAKNIELNGFNVQCHQIALSNISGTQTFYDVSSGNPTSSSLSAAMISNNANIRNYDVNTMTMDDFIKANPTSRPDLMKIDVEMHEPELMEGFSSIRECRPIVFIEVLTDAIANRLNTLLEDADMVFFELNFYSLRQIPALTKGRPYFWNFLIVPREKLHLVNQFIATA